MKQQRRPSKLSIGTIKIIVLLLTMFHLCGGFKLDKSLKQPIIGSDTFAVSSSTDRHFVSNALVDTAVTAIVKHQKSVTSTIIAAPAGSRLDNSVLKSKVDILSTIFKKSINKLKHKTKKIDIVFLIDSSSSVGKTNFQSEIKFVKKILSDFTVSYNNTRVGIVTFSSQSKITRHIDQISMATDENDKCKLLNYQIPKISFVGGGTFTYGALREAKEIFVKARKNSRKIIFLITDGFSNGRNPVPLARQLKNDNVTIVTIGIQTGNFAELYNISSPPGEYHSFLLDSFVQFESLARKALHIDFRSGNNIHVKNQSLCNILCAKEKLSGVPPSSSCCDQNAECTCGHYSGHYSCICNPGYYGTGLHNECYLCQNGTFWKSSNLCYPCPDINHITLQVPAVNLSHCVCKIGFKATEQNRCEVITCSQLRPPDNGYFVKHPSGCGSVLNAACGARCKSGFQLGGSSIRLCQQNGTWSGSDTSCLLKTCPSIPIPYFGHAVCRNTDLNMHFDFTSRNSSFMNYYQNDSLRVTEPMPIDTDCTFKCSPGFYLIGSGSRNCLPLSKWDGLQTGCKQILCLPLPKIPFGHYEPMECANVKLVHGTNCSIICSPGFELKGPAWKACGGKRNGVWSNKNKIAKCIDVAPPTLKCPENYSIPMAEFSNYAIVHKLNGPIVSDNSGQKVTYWSRPAIPKKDGGLRLPMGENVFNYVAVDSSKNKARCNFTVTVIDVTPPLLDNCIDPPDIYIPVETKFDANKSYVEWDDPIIYDNSNRHVNIIQSVQPGFLGPGVHQVVYVATDLASNANSCTIKVTVKEIKCDVLLSPMNGNTICAKNLTHMWCETICKFGYAIYDEFEEHHLESTTLYCENDFPSWKYNPIPDCSAIELPDTVEEIISMSVNSDQPICDASSSKDLLVDELKQYITDHLCKDQEGCEIVSDIPDCEEEISASNGNESVNTFYKVVKREVAASMPKRRRANIRINVYARLGRRLGLWKPNSTRSENIKSLKMEIRNMHKNERLQKKLTEIKMTINQLELIEFIRCPNGTVPKRHLCMQCPRGTFQNGTVCQQCPLGTYNNQTSQLECHKCPVNYFTRKIGSKTPDECKQQCLPGTIARIKTLKKIRADNVQTQNSLMPFCRKCAANEYQPGHDQIQCIPCPVGHISRRGSTQLADCEPKRVLPCLIRPSICGGNGECVADPRNNYFYNCLCNSNFMGAHCEHQFDLCLSSPCANGGSCENVNGSKFTCQCSYPFTGPLCEEVEDPCHPLNPCQNNGNCTEIDGQPFCECPNRVDGDFCEKTFDFCAQVPCEFGECINKLDGFQCVCPPGVIGRRCQLRPCDYMPCPQAAFCVDLFEMPATRNSYKCECPKGLKGFNCTEVDNPCDRSPCKNNGHCIPTVLRDPTIVTGFPDSYNEDKYEQYGCQCQPYFYGKNCETLTTPDFILEFPKGGVSDYIQLNGPKVDLTEISLCTWMISNDTFNYGTIISYATESSDNMFTITDYNGLVFYIAGQHIVTDLVLNDGIWHFLCVAWMSDRGFYEIYLDGTLLVTGFNFSIGKQIERNGVIVVGQEQDEIGAEFSESESFIGAIAYMDVWSRFLSAQEVQEHFYTCEPYQGDLYSWTDFKAHIKGHVQISPSSFCKSCPTDLKVSNGNVTIIDNTARYMCDSGYQLQGLTFQNCLKFSDWQQPIPTCKVIRCGHPGSISNGHVSVTRYTLGGTAAYTCNEGYSLKGSVERNCVANSTWLEPLPECMSFTQCKRFHPIENGLVRYIGDRGSLGLNMEQYSLGTIAEIQCYSDSVMIGENVLTCIENGLWDYALPKCVRRVKPVNATLASFPIQKFLTINKEYITFTYKKDSDNARDSVQASTQTTQTETSPSRIIPDKSFWINFKTFLLNGCPSIELSEFCQVAPLTVYRSLSDFELPDLPDYRNMDTKLLAMIERTIASVNHRHLLPWTLFDELLTHFTEISDRKITATMEDALRLITQFYIDTIIANVGVDKPSPPESIEISATNNISLKIKRLLVRLAEPVYENWLNKVESSSSTTERIETELRCPMLLLGAKMHVDRIKAIDGVAVVEPSIGQSEMFAIGTKVFLNCTEDSELVGLNFAECLAHENWSATGSCIDLVVCEQLPTVSLMSAILTDEQQRSSIRLHPGAKVLYKCQEGYILQGNPTTQCAANGKWTKMYARCSKLSCNKPNLPSNTSIIGGRSYLYLEKLKVKCSTNGKIVEIECTSSGEWFPNNICAA